MTIATTHVGSLPRGDDLEALLIGRDRGEDIDFDALEASIQTRVNEVVSRQVASGLDIVNDGEQSRPGFQTYVAQRMQGFGGESRRRVNIDSTKYPALAQIMRQRMGKVARVRNAPQAIGPIVYDDMSFVERDCRRLHAAIAAAERPVQGFMTAASPGVVATTLLNAHYNSEDAYMAALADALAKEYRVIVEAGFILQIDAPDLAMERNIHYQDLDLASWLDRVAVHVEMVNRAIGDLPRERIRLHCCWGNWDGPHIDDVDLVDVLPILYRTNVGGLSIPLGNPRHAHEYRVFRDLPLPDHMTLLPGVIESTSNYVEHPQVVADRLANIIDAVGDESRVIASTDCGFGTFAGYTFVAEPVVWEKLKALSAGAALIH